MACCSQRCSWKPRSSPTRALSPQIVSILTRRTRSHKIIHARAMQARGKANFGLRGKYKAVIRPILKWRDLMGEFPDEVIEASWKRSKSQCECERDHSWHRSFRCHQHLLKRYRGKDSHFSWEAHHADSNGPDTLRNCEILCPRCARIAVRV